MISSLVPPCCSHNVTLGFKKQDGKGHKATTQASQPNRWRHVGLTTLINCARVKAEHYLAMSSCFHSPVWSHLYAINAFPDVMLALVFQSSSFKVSHLLYIHPHSIPLPSLSSSILSSHSTSNFFFFYPLCIFVLYFLVSNFLFTLSARFDSALHHSSLSVVVCSTSGKAQRWVGLNFDMKFQTRAHTPRVSLCCEWEGRW